MIRADQTRVAATAAPSEPAARAQSPVPGDAVRPDSFERSPRVTTQGAARIVRGELLLDGKPTFLYGGELQYFRVRDAHGDVARTHAMWAETLDAMRDAKMNLVTTYVPWDYHEGAKGAFDFTGVRDLGLFLQMVKDRGMRAMVKPGPLITAEWPGDFGTFGAVPSWWKKAHPEALERTANGAIYSFAGNGDLDQAQPAYLHPAYLSAVGDYYARFAEIVRPFLGDTIIGVQIDNETNHYWGSPIGGAGYSDSALAYYRGHLRATYDSIASLNRTYGTRYSSFDDVPPPTENPRRTDAKSNNPWLRDWYDAGQRYTETYLQALKGSLERVGIAEPEVLLFVNDSPFTLGADRFQIRNVRLPDGGKRAVARLGADLYPKFIPGPFPADAPWQADFFARRYDGQNGAGDDEGRWLFGAELQAGTPLHIGPFRFKVPHYATDQMLARSFGRGLKGSSLYVMRDGLNGNGTKYDFGGPLDINGKTNERYGVAKKWGSFLAAHGAELQRSVEVTNRVAILVNERFAAPQAGVRDNLQQLQTIGNPAIFGWLTNAGINPEIVEATSVTAEELARYAVVFAQVPDVPDARMTTLMNDHPGTVVTLLGPGAKTDGELARDFGVVRNGEHNFYIPYIDGSASFALEGTTGGVATLYEKAFFTPAPGSDAKPFLWTRGWFEGRKPMGFMQGDGAKKRVVIGANLHSGFNQVGYYAKSVKAFDGITTLGAQLVKLGGEEPIVTTGKTREIAWARRSSVSTFVFCVNDKSCATDTKLTLAQPDKLGIHADTTYDVVDALNDRAIGRYSGADLARDGITAHLTAYGTAVIRISASTTSAERTLEQTV